MLHSFPLSFTAGHEVQSVVGLGRRLDLGVGGDGVLGRTISIVDMQRRVLGQGIIGRI